MAPDPTSPAAPRREDGPTWWPYLRAFIAPLLIWLLLLALVLPLVVGWVHGQDHYNREAIQEWIDEARNPSATLADLTEQYVEQAVELGAVADQLARLKQELGDIGPVGVGFGDPAETDPKKRLYRDLDLRDKELRELLRARRQVIAEFLRALGEPATKMYPGQLPLFPVVYRLVVNFQHTAIAGRDLALLGGARLNQPIVWESGLEPSAESYQDQTVPLRGGAEVRIVCQVRAWNKRQQADQEKARRAQLLMVLGVAATVLAVAWVMLLHSGERERQRQRQQARDELERAELQRVATERQLLEQRLATQAAERQALELRSHLYASIGIMAGSYAHNIKNLLVRPNDLLRRCLESADGDAEQGRMLREVQATLGMVTERLQQILHTVRRDPSKAELKPTDVAALARAVGRTWGELAGDRWQLDLEVEVSGEPLLVLGDDSHLQQALENLVFNARDAVFEMRDHLRSEARQAEAGQRRQALIAAAAWRGRVVVRAARVGEEVWLEVADNGAGMSEEVKRRCTESLFTTKRDNAKHEGHSTGMGLGLSFVVAILGHHHARLEIESAPRKGSTFRARFAPAGAM